MIIFFKYYFADFLENIPGSLIVGNCIESKYHMNDTIVKLQSKLKSINSLAANFLNTFNATELALSLNTTDTIMALNSTVQVLDLNKEIIDHYNATPTAEIPRHCIAELWQTK